MKVNMLYGLLGIGTMSIGYLGYYKVNKAYDANKCPVDHKSRQDMVEQGRKKRRE